MLQGNDGYTMMIVYDAGFIAVFAVFVMLYHQAWRFRERLALDASERFELLQRMGCFGSPR